MKINFYRHIKTAAKIILSLGILGFVFYKIDTEALLEVLKKVNGIYLFMALLSFTLSKLISAYRLNHFLSATEIRISNGYNIKLYLLGMFYNLFLPGGIGGDGYKIYLLNKRFEVKAKDIFWAILLDRVMGLLALFCLVAGISAFVPLPDIYRKYGWLLIPVAVLSFYLFVRILFSRYSGIFFKTLGQSFFVQIFQVLTAVCILLAIGVFDQSLAYIFVFLISSIVASLPITIGGIGSREITFLFGAEIMHLNISDSIALSLLFYLITALVSLSGIYYSFRNNKLR